MYRRTTQPPYTFCEPLIHKGDVRRHIRQCSDRGKPKNRKSDTLALCGRPVDWDYQTDEITPDGLVDCCIQCKKQYAYEQTHGIPEYPCPPPTKNFILKLTHGTF
jgi:hypothetical protein